MYYNTYMFSAFSSVWSVNFEMFTFSFFFFHSLISFRRCRVLAESCDWRRRDESCTLPVHCVFRNNCTLRVLARSFETRCRGFCILSLFLYFYYFFQRVERRIVSGIRHSFIIVGKEVIISCRLEKLRHLDRVRVEHIATNTYVVVSSRQKVGMAKPRLRPLFTIVYTATVVRDRRRF